jgi:hypothetical protein
MLYIVSLLFSETDCSYQRQNGAIYIEQLCSNYVARNTANNCDVYICFFLILIIMNDQSSIGVEFMMFSY